jgi:putrescine transport system substrate-binding protein
MRTIALAGALTLALLAGGCGGKQGNGAPAPAADAEPKLLNVYSWSLYIAPDTVAEFEKRTGIKVNYSTYDSNELLETKLFTGNTGYDIVVPTVTFFERQAKAGIYRKLDKSLLPNLKSLDPDIMRRLALHDPGTEHAIPYLWSMVGLGFNQDEIAKRLGGVPDGWSLIMDPANAAKLKSCGISLLDAPADVIGAVLIHLGKDANSTDERELGAAFDVLHKIRPYIRSFDSEQYIAELSNGGVCAVLGWSGDIVQARNRAREAGNGTRIAFLLPKEGSLMTLDAMAIPADAPHPRNAQAFMNFLMEPAVIAHITDAVGYPNGNREATALVSAALREDPAVYPDDAARARLQTQHAKSLEYSRFLSREWTKLKTGS